MADTKISQLPPITGANLADTDEFVVARASTTQNFSVTRAEMFQSLPSIGVDGDITVTGTVDGRDVAADGTKLDGIEAGADVTDTTNVTAAGALMRSGGTMLGDLVLNADPTANLGAATKQYVDTIAAAGIHYHPPVRAESPINLPSTYDNGTAGVGATLTNSGFQTNISIDGVTLDVNDRVLIYRQTNSAHNGVYVVTDIGSGSTNWVLTRATDADSYSPSDPDSLGQGDAFYVQEGDTGAGELYVMNTTGAITFGTTDISFIQISSTAIYSAGNGIALNGTVFSVSAGGGLAQQANGLAHDDTSAQPSVTNTGSTVIQSMQVDGYGHVTVINSKTLGLGDFGLTANATELNYVDGVTSSIQGQLTAITSTTVSAGAGLSGGGDLTTNRTISHADTSSQASVNNTGATVIQDVTLDGYGHVTALGSATLTAAAVGAVPSTGGIFTGTVTFPNTTNTGTAHWQVSAADIALQRADARDDAANFARLHWYGQSDTSATSNFRHAWYDGAAYTNVTVNAGGRIDFTGTASSMYIGTDRVYDDGYHPNADTWTTGRTLTIGDTGKSVNGGGNVSWSLAEIGALPLSGGTLSGDLYISATQSQIYGGFGAKTTGGSTDWNDVTNARSGNGNTLLLGTATNGPGVAGYFHPFSFEYNSKNGAGNMTQFAIPYNTDTMFFRYRFGGTWTGWIRFFTENYHPNADTLTTARTINGTSFNGSANITTSTWGTARTIWGQSINGSANITAPVLPAAGSVSAPAFSNAADTNTGIYFSSADVMNVTTGGTLAATFAANGDFTATGNVTAFSDIRLKEDLEQITDALDKVRSLTGYTYTRTDSGERHVGLIAQDVQKVMPEAVHDDGEHLSLAYGNLVALLVEAIKDQQDQIDDLKTKLGV